MIYCLEQSRLFSYSLSNRLWQLAHTIGVNDWFTALAATAHRSAGSAALTAWWSETRCARHFGDLVRPDAYGRWHNHGCQVEFFVEYDGRQLARDNADRLGVKYITFDGKIWSVDGYQAKRSGESEPARWS